MASFEFYGREHFASCQYHAEEFFAVLEQAKGDYPFLKLAQRAFVGMYDDIFSFEAGDTRALEVEVTTLQKAVSMDLENPAQEHKVFALVSVELKAVFEESRAKRTDIRFRWG